MKKKKNQLNTSTSNKHKQDTLGWRKRKMEKKIKKMIEGE